MTTCTTAQLQAAIKADLKATFGTTDLTKVKTILKGKCDADGGARVQGKQFIFRYSRNTNSCFTYSVSWQGNSKALDGGSFGKGIERNLGDSYLTTPVFGKPYEVDFLARLVRK